MATLNKHVKAVIQLRRATEREWIDYNPILRLGEPALSTDGSYITIKKVYGVRAIDSDAIAEQADYIVEQGTDGDTTYRKWNSGIAEMWINTTQNVALNNAYGSLYQGAWSWNFPFAFVSKPIVTTSRFCWGTGASWGQTAGVSTSSAFLRGIDIASRASGSCEIMAYAIGRWK